MRKTSKLDFDLDQKGVKKNVTTKRITNIKSLVNNFLNIKQVSDCQLFVDMSSIRFWFAPFHESGPFILVINY